MALRWRIIRPVPPGLSGDSGHAQPEDKLLSAAALIGEFTAEDLVDCLCDPELQKMIPRWLDSAEREGLIERYRVGPVQLHVVTARGRERL